MLTILSYCLSWVGNVLLLCGIVTVGYKRRIGFLIATAGESLWAVYAYQLKMYDLLLICFMFIVVDLHNWWKWRPRPFNSAELEQAEAARQKPDNHGYTEPVVVPMYLAKHMLSVAKAHDEAKIRSLPAARQGDKLMIKEFEDVIVRYAEH